MKNIEELKAFGRRVKHLRLQAGMTQLDLSVEADIGTRTVQKIELAEGPVSIELVFSIAKALKVTPDILFRD